MSLCLSKQLEGGNNKTGSAANLKHKIFFLFLILFGKKYYDVNK